MTKGRRKKHERRELSQYDLFSSYSCQYLFATTVGLSKTYINFGHSNIGQYFYKAGKSYF